METILKCSLFDYIISITFILAIFLNTVLSVINYFKNNNLKNLYNVLITTKKYIYPFIWIISIPFIIVFIIYLFIRKHKYYNIIFVLFLIICAFYYIYKIIKIINKKNFNKNNFSYIDIKNIIFAELIYFLFFSRQVYLSFITNFNNIENKFISDFIIIVYMTLKFFLSLFFIATNLILISKKAYKLICPNLYSFFIKIKNKANEFELKFEIINNIKPNLFFANKTINKKILNFINRILFLIVIPIFILIFYLIEISKILFLLIINLIITILSFIKKELKNEIIFFYRLLYLCIFISISLIYGHILNHDTFEPSSVNFFEFLGITIFITIIMQQLKDTETYKNNIKTII